jgi:WD repeat-containing protein 35
VTTWNPTYRKLTTSDHRGLIIVWMLHKGAWFEEMINNRNKSVVTDMRWRHNGQEICIAYEDGVVIVGGVDGNRLWSKDMGAALTLVEWAPDGRTLLFATSAGDLLIHNHQGVRLGTAPLPAVRDVGRPVRISAVEWYDGAEGAPYADAPSLAVAFENGRVQIMRGPDDDAPVLIDTGLRLTHAKWNPSGTVLALAGDGSPGSEVQFYSCLGRYRTALRVPGGAVSAMSWEGGGLRLALAVDSFVYFANVRPQYRWGSFGDTVVYAFAKPGRDDTCVVFWNVKTNERHTKNVRGLLTIAAAGEHCALISTAADDGGAAGAASAGSGAGAAAAAGAGAAVQYTVTLCNAIGSPVDAKHVSVHPDHVAMTPFHVAVASADTLYVWNFRTQVSRLTSVDSNSLRRKEGRERVFQLDPGAADGDGAAGGGGGGGGAAGAGGPICAVAASAKYLLVARESGVVYQYQLPALILENKFRLRCRPQSLHLNCDSTRFAVIDLGNVLSFFDMEARTVGASGSTTIGEHLPFERKDVWVRRAGRSSPVRRPRPTKPPARSRLGLTRSLHRRATCAPLGPARPPPSPPSPLPFTAGHDVGGRLPGPVGHDGKDADVRVSRRRAGGAGPVVRVHPPLLRPHHLLRPPGRGV